MDDLFGRFFVVEGADIPSDVRSELEAFVPSPDNGEAGTRSFGGDLFVAVLGGVIGAGVWDELPLWAAWVSGMRAPRHRADPDDVIRNVAAVCVRAGLAKRTSDVVISQLLEAPRSGWTGIATTKRARVTFSADASGAVVTFDAAPS